MPHKRTLEEIKRDLQTYKDLSKRQDGVTIYAEKYVEDLGIIIDMLEGQKAEGPRSRKPKALKTD